MGNHRRCDRGAAAVEFAILLPLLLLIVFEIISWGYMFSFRQALSQAAEEGARAAVGGPASGCPATASWNVSGCAPGTAAAGAVANALSSYQNGGAALTCDGGGLTCSIAQAPVSSCQASVCVQVTVTYPYRSQPLLHGMPSGVPPFSLVLPPDLTFTSIVGVS